MFKEMWWCNYCVCCGRGIGDIGNPLVGGINKQLCILQSCQMTDVGDPFCGGLNVFCCVTEQCHIPPTEGSPTCACFGKTLVGSVGDAWKAELFDYKPNWKQAGFPVIYVVCCGSFLHAPGANGAPLLGAKSKFLCIQEAMKLVSPVEDGIFCASASTFLCCWDQCELPPNKGNPGFKCVGKPDGGKSNANVSPMGYGKPGQAEMS